MKYILLIFALIQMILLNKSCAQDNLIGYWEGKIEYQNRVWDIGIDVGSENKAKIYSTAGWRSDEAAENYSISNNKINFDIPIYQIGKFEGIFDGKEISGTVQLTDENIKVPVNLQKSTLKEIRKEDVLLKHDSLTIGASLILPKETGKYPVVVVLHGGGDSNREESLGYSFWGKYLARNGIACLIYDKRGNGISTGDWRTVGFDARADDVISGLKFLENHQEVDKDKMSLMGISQGSWVAGVVASRYQNISSVINVVGPLVSPYEADTYALKYSLRSEGWPLKDIKERTHLWSLVSEYIRNPQVESEWENLQNSIDKVKSHNWYLKDPYEPNRNSWFYNWYSMVLDHDPMPILEELEMPMLWIYGNRDSQSDFARNIALINSLKRAGKPYELIVIPDAGHGVACPVDVDGNHDFPLASPTYFFEGVLEFILEN